METIKQLDEQIFLFLNNNLGHASWDGFWLIITDQWMSIPIYALLTILMYVKTGFRSTFISLATIFFMLVVVYGLSRLSKYGIARPRPCTMDFNVYYPLSEDCGDFGFFSSHASVGMALMLFIGHVLKPYYKYIFWPLFIWLFLFCFSRIYVGKHYPGDIIVGFIVGFVFGFLFYKLRKYILKRYKV